MGIFSILGLGKSDTLYFPGCTTYFKFQQNYELYQKIFSKLGVNFKISEKKVCSGLSALEAGYEQEARKLARRNFEIFKEEGIKSIITNSPEAYKMFLYNYPEILPDWNISVKNLWAIILDKLKTKPRLIKYKTTESVTYQDSCYLGRYCGIYDEPREILKLIGYEIKELFDSRSESICCGSCGGLPIANAELANEIAKEKILQAKRIGVKKIIVVSMKNYELLKKNAKDSEIEILELSEVLALALGIKIKEKEQTIGEQLEEEQPEEDLIIDIKPDENETKGKLKPQETEGVLGEEEKIED
jgi:Fe-S oxidoreductase